MKERSRSNMEHHWNMMKDLKRNQLRRKNHMSYSIKMMWLIRDLENKFLWC